MLKAKISEVFFSIQGEGVYVGTGHVFVRFFGCDIECRYCDTKQLGYKEYSVDELIFKVEKIKKKYRANYISLTGGEPLLQADFIRDFLKKANYKRTFIYLETNGLLYKEFLKIKDSIDIVSMDFKLPSTSGLADTWKAHERFLKQAKAKTVFVKAVVDLNTKKQEIEKAAQLIAQVNKNIALVLQPEHSQLSERLINKTLAQQILGMQYINDVRIIPQFHKIIGVP
jgi:organic radical activating enzyme